MPIFRKIARLSADDYIGQRSYFVTICRDLKRKHLAESNVASRVLYVMKECAARRAFTLHAFCIMPDHVHFLAEGTRPSSNLLELVRIFKLRTAFEYRKSHGRRLWEMSYYDHVLRSSDVLEDIACYIWLNPVRKGLCPTAQAYPYSGSQTIPWMRLAPLSTTWSPPWKL